jgi:hypothetical protein
VHLRRHAAASTEAPQDDDGDDDDEYGDMADEGLKHVFPSHTLESGVELREVCACVAIRGELNESVRLVGGRTVALGRGA